MRFFGYAAAVMAASASLVAAQEGIEGTTTLTSTLTRTITITDCAPDVPDCPGRTTTVITSTEAVVTTTPEPVTTTSSSSSSSSVYTSWSVSNSTTTAGPTATSTFVSLPQTTTTEGDSSEPSGPATTSPAPGAANGLVAQSGLVVAVFAAAAAALF